MLERVARALCKTDDLGLYCSNPDEIVTGVPAWRLYETQARAAIAAMGRPSREEASEFSAALQKQIEADGMISPDVLRDAMAAMLDAATKAAGATRLAG